MEAKTDEDELPVETAPFWKKRRYLVVMLAFFGYFNVYAMRANLSVAIIAMTEVRNIQQADGTLTQEQDFEWTSVQKGVVISSFYYGYVISQPFGGYLGFRFGGNRMFAIGVFVKSILTVLTPLIVKLNFYFFIAIRIVEGIFEGFTIPCMPDVWSYWAPPLERSRMASFAFAGIFLGTLVTFPLSGVFAVAFGWESVFYIFGIVAFIWSLIWTLIVKRSPQKDRKISKEEKLYILKSLKTDKSHRRLKFDEIPLKKILMSGPVWAIIVSNFSESWGFVTMLTQLPMFMNDVLSFNLMNSAFWSGFPLLAMTVSTFVSGFFADWLQVKKILTTTQVRRYFNCISFMGQTVFLVICAFLSHPIFSVLSLTIGVAIGSLSTSGYVVNNLDIAPNYASIIFGISNSIGGVGELIASTLPGFIVRNKSKSEWQIIFFIAAGFYLFGCVFYWFFVSGNLQSWAESDAVQRNSHKEAAKVSN